MDEVGRPSSGRGRDLYPQQLVGEDVPEDGEEEEGDEGEDDDPPGALLLQTLLVAAQDEQTHADAHHRPRQVSHEAGLGPRGGQGRRETQPHGPAHLRTHCHAEKERRAGREHAQRGVGGRGGIRGGVGGKEYDWSQVGIPVTAETKARIIARPLLTVQSGWG